MTLSGLPKASSSRSRRSNKCALKRSVTNRILWASLQLSKLFATMFQAPSLLLNLIRSRPQLFCTHSLSMTTKMDTTVWTISLVVSSLTTWSATFTLTRIRVAYNALERSVVMALSLTSASKKVKRSLVSMAITMTVRIALVFRASDLSFGSPPSEFASK